MDYKKKYLKYKNKYLNLKKLVGGAGSDGASVKPKEASIGLKNRVSGNSPAMMAIASGLSLRQMLIPGFRDVEGVSYAIQTRIKNNPEEAKQLVFDASKKGLTRIVKVLLDNGADTDVKDEEGYAPLHWAAQEGHTDIVMMLLDAGADMDVKDEEDWTPLHWAAYFGYTDIVMELLVAGAEFLVKTSSGYTPLHYAAGGRHTELVELMVWWFKNAKKEGLSKRKSKK